MPAPRYFRASVMLVWDNVPDEAVAVANRAPCPHHPGNRICALERRAGVFRCEGSDHEGGPVAQHEHEMPPLLILGVEGHLMTVLDRATNERTIYEGRIFVPPAPLEDETGEQGRPPKASWGEG